MANTPFYVIRDPEEDPNTGVDLLGGWRSNESLREEELRWRLG